MDTTGRGFADFWSSAARRGLMKANTASSFAAPVRKVLSVEPEWESADITQLDVEHLLERFRNLHATELTPNSLGAYERRFKGALQIYLEYVRNPTRWKYKGQSQPARKKTAKPDGGASPKADDGEVIDAPGGSASSAQLLDYPFRLREDCIVRLRLPADLRVAEVERLATMMRTLAVDFDTAQS